MLWGFREQDDLATLTLNEVTRPGSRWGMDHGPGIRGSNGLVTGRLSTGYAPVSFSLQLKFKLSFERWDVAGRDTVGLPEPFESLSD